MSIKQHLENALRSIETDKDRAIATAKEKCINVLTSKLSAYELAVLLSGELK
jgi:hypothetical protein